MLITRLSVQKVKGIRFPLRRLFSIDNSFNFFKSGNSLERSFQKDFHNVLIHQTDLQDAITQSLSETNLDTYSEKFTLEYKNKFNMFFSQRTNKSIYCFENESENNKEEELEGDKTKEEEKENDESEDSEDSEDDFDDENAGGMKIPLFEWIFNRI